MFNTRSWGTPTQITPMLFLFLSYLTSSRYNHDGAKISNWIVSLQYWIQQWYFCMGTNKMKNTKLPGLEHELWRHYTADAKRGSNWVVRKCVQMLFFSPFNTDSSSTYHVLKHCARYKRQKIKHDLVPALQLLTQSIRYVDSIMGGNVTDEAAL